MLNVDDIKDQLKVSDFLSKWEIEQSFDKLNWFIDRKRTHWMLWFWTPYPEIDKVTEWFIPWHVYTIWAYSNTGKSRFCYSYVNKFLQDGKSVIFFNLEVSKGIFLKNIICNRYWVTSNDIMHAWCVKDDMMDDFKNLKVFDEVYMIDEIEQVVQFYKPDFVFIDFIQNVDTNNKSAYEKMSEIAKKIQRLAITIWSCVVSISQLSNAVGKQLSCWDTDFISLKGAGELYASSDGIFILYRDWEELNLHIAKNKYWRAKINFWIEPENWEQSKFRLKPRY